MFTKQDYTDLDYALDCAIYEIDEFISEIFNVWNNRRNSYALERMNELMMEKERIQKLKDKIKNEQ